MKQYVLRVSYGTGSASMLVDTPDLIVAIKEFQKEYSASLPDTKMYGLPQITSAELIPLMYRTKYEPKEIKVDEKA